MNNYGMRSKVGPAEATETHIVPRLSARLVRTILVLLVAFAPF
jgi:hypothetical protein